MITLVAFAILSLTVATISKAISMDTIGLPLARWVDAKFGPNSWPSTLVSCYWCNSMWVSVPVCGTALPLVALVYGKPWWWGLVATVFVAPAVRYAASVIIDKTKVG